MALVLVVAVGLAGLPVAAAANAGEAGEPADVRRSVEGDVVGVQSDLAVHVATEDDPEEEEENCSPYCFGALEALS